MPCLLCLACLCFVLLHSAASAREQACQVQAQALTLAATGSLHLSIEHCQVSALAGGQGPEATCSAVLPPAAGADGEHLPAARSHRGPAIPARRAEHAAHPAHALARTLWIRLPGRHRLRWPPDAVTRIPAQGLRARMHALQHSWICIVVCIAHATLPRTARTHRMPMPAADTTPRRTPAAGSQSCVLHASPSPWALGADC